MSNGIVPGRDFSMTSQKLYWPEWTNDLAETDIGTGLGNGIGLGMAWSWAGLGLG
jgi:hypothetical protein